MLKGTKLIQDTAQCPDITFEGIRLVLTHLGAHIIWSSDHGHGRGICILKHSRYTEVA